MGDDESMRGHDNNRSSTEFDQYEDGYSAGMDNPIKSSLGNSPMDFIAVKLEWFERRFPSVQADDSVRLLDYGCGSGTLLFGMCARGWRVNKTGCDVSIKMLEEAERSVQGEDCEAIDWVIQNGSSVPFASGSFDFVVVSSVLHHIEPDDRDFALSEIWRVLTPGGRVIVLEHNPFNPLTRYVVARTPIDANAVLLTRGEAMSRLRCCGFLLEGSDYIMFFPPKATRLRRLDLLFSWLPLGAQYAVWARKPT